MGKRYAILDKIGVCINSVLIDDPMPANYWPGYGAFLLPLEAVTKSTGGTLAVLSITPDKTVQIGDSVNLKTGAVTEYVAPSDITGAKLAYDTSAKYVNQTSDGQKAIDSGTATGTK